MAVVEWAEVRWRRGFIAGTKFHDRIAAGGFIRAEDQLQRLEIVCARGFAGRFPTQCRQQITMTRHHAGLRNVVARIGPRVARRRVTTALRALLRRDAQPIVAGDFNAAERSFDERQRLRKAFTFQRRLRVTQLDDHARLRLAHREQQRRHVVALHVGRERSVQLTVERTRLAETGASGVEKVRAEIGQDELRQLAQRRLVRPDIEARDHGEPRAERRPDDAGAQRVDERPHRRLPAPVLMDEECRLRFGERGDHFARVFQGSRHRLLADARDAVLRAEQRERHVSADLGDVVHEVRLHFAQQLFGIVIDGRHTEIAGEGFGLGARTIVDGDTLHAAHLTPRGELAARPKPGAEDGEACLIH